MKNQPNASRDSTTNHDNSETCFMNRNTDTTIFFYDYVQNMKYHYFNLTVMLICVSCQRIKDPPLASSSAATRPAGTAMLV